MNIAIRDKGGRPKKDFIRSQIIEVMSKLGKVMPLEAYKTYKKDFKDSRDIVSYRTFFRYIKRMAKEKALDETQVSEGRQRILSMYELAKEKA